MSDRDQVIALLGPTGVGKTEIALDVAERLGAEIVGADSRQVYRYLDIGTAKPTPQQRARVPHHLIDVADPDEPFDCARYRELALEAIAGIRARGRRALLVGGTGLYVKVLAGGLCAAPPRDAALRERLEAEERDDPGSLHRRLREVDSVAAARLHPNDRVRLVRALEVATLSGTPLSEWQARHGFSQGALQLRTMALSTDRAELYERIGQRCRAMVDAGLAEEVRSLWARGFGPDLAPLSSIGYREIGAYLRGEIDIEVALERMARATRQFAKRQLTWLRGVPDLRVVDAHGGSEAVLRALPD